MVSESSHTPVPPRLDSFLRAELQGIGSAWPEDVEEADARAFVEALEWHGVAPILLEKASSRLPDNVRDLLRKSVLLQVALEHERLRELRSVAAALHDQQVKALVMKGSALAYQIYPAAYLRPRADHDLLIDAARIEEVRALFRSRDYKEHSTGGSLIIAQTSFSREADPGAHVFDIHWRTSNVHVVSDALDAATLYEHAVRHPQIEHLLVPSLDHSLLVALLHRAAHHHDSNRLIWLADIDLLVRRLGTETVGAILEDARTRGALSVCVRGLELTSRWFATPLPALPAITGDRLQWLVARRVRRLEFFLRDLRALPSWRSRAQWLRELAFPSREFMTTHFAVKDEESLSRLYLRRGLRGARRLFRRMGPS